MVGNHPNPRPKERAICFEFSWRRVDRNQMNFLQGKILFQRVSTVVEEACFLAPTRWHCLKLHTVMKLHTVNFNIIIFIKPYISIIQGLLVIPVSWFLIMDRVPEGCISKQLHTYSHSHFLQTLEPLLITAAQNQCHCFSPFEKGNMQKHCINPKKP